MTRYNQLEQLTDQQRQAVLLGADALKELHGYARKSFDQWMLVAHGIAPLCELAAQPGTSRKARKVFLRDNGYGALDEGTVSRLLLMAEHDVAIRIWRESLTERQRDSWNGPTSICQRCPAVRAAMLEAAKNKPPRTPRKPVNRPAKVEQALDVVGDYLHDVEDVDARAVIAERIARMIGAAPAASHGEATAPPLTIAEHFTALADLLKDEHPAAIQNLFNAFTQEVQAAYKARRAEGAPCRPAADESKPQPKRRAKAARDPLKQAERDINAALGGLLTGRGHR